MFVSTRTFGVELEAHLPAGGTRGQLAALMRRRNIEARVENYNHDARPYWKLTTDGSLGWNPNESVEVVSPVLSGETGLREVGAVVKAMAEFGCHISVKCGLHVHVFAKDLGVDGLRKLAINFVHNETAFDAIMPPSRRADLNQYILSNRSAFGGYHGGETINKAIAAFKAARDEATLIATVAGANRGNGWDHAARYRKLNFKALARYGTVEFRQHSGTVDPEKAMNWVRLVVGFVDRTPTSQARTRVVTDRALCPVRELNQLLKFVRATPEMRRYYQARRKALTEARLAREAARLGYSYQIPAE